MQLDLSAYLNNFILSDRAIKLFQQHIYNYYAQNNRKFAWRETDNAYYIVVSEIMLQQTQTHRVQEKYQQFIAKFPTISDLAKASIRDVLAVWQGLGYNRRALALHEFAQRITDQYCCVIPQCPEILVSFKSIGPNTAGSICAFAFNQATVFIETNIRAVFIDCFFSQKNNIEDRDILLLIKQTVDKNNPRIWYYALMDYGAMLKKLYKNPNKKSAHYSVQSKFEGSDRQIRGQILKLLLAHDSLSLEILQQKCQQKAEKLIMLLGQLESEKFIEKNKNSFTLKK